MRQAVLLVAASMAVLHDTIRGGKMGRKSTLASLLLDDFRPHNTTTNDEHLVICILTIIEIKAKYGLVVGKSQRDL